MDEFWCQKWEYERKYLFIEQIKVGTDVLWHQQFRGTFHPRSAELKHRKIDLNMYIEKISFKVHKGQKVLIVFAHACSLNLNYGIV